MPSKSAKRTAAGAIGSLLVGCAALSPQVFAPDVDPPAVAAPPSGDAAVDRVPLTHSPRPVAAVASAAAGSKGAYELKQATINARALQQRYVASARSLSDGNAGIAASLLGIGTAGGIKAVSNPITRDISGLAIALGGLFTYGNTMVSLPRAKAYVAGAHALECAIEAAAAIGDTNLAPAITEAQGHQTTLRHAIHRLDAWQRPKPSVRFSGGATSGCSTLAVGCGSPEMASKEDRERHARLCKATEENRARHCTPLTRSDVEIPAHADVGATLNWAREIRDTLSIALADAARARPQVDLAGSTLRGRTRAIEAAVFYEVAKTEPDLNAIKSAAGAIVDTGTAFIPRTKPSTAPAEAAGLALSSSTVAARKSDEVQPRPAELDDEAMKVAAASQAVESLNRALAELEERSRRAKALDSCTVPGGQRPVTFFVDTPRAETAPVPLDDNLRRRLAPSLGKDVAAPNVARQVDEALRDCRERGRIPESGSAGSLQQSTVVAITLGRCTAPS